MESGSGWGIRVFVDDFDIKSVGKKCISIQVLRLILKPSSKNTVIYSGLQLFDFNIIVILIVMILVATINMVVALLVLILERTQMMQKHLGLIIGASVKYFFIMRLSNSSGIVLGNLIGIAILLLQKYFGIINSILSITLIRHRYISIGDILHY
jgi:lipoprotein-releasing system permease protein